MLFPCVPLLPDTFFNLVKMFHNLVWCKVVVNKFLPKIVLLHCGGLFLSHFYECGFKGRGTPDFVECFEACVLLDQMIVP